MSESQAVRRSDSTSLLPGSSLTRKGMLRLSVTAYELSSLLPMPGEDYNHDNYHSFFPFVSAALLRGQLKEQHLFASSTTAKTTSGVQMRSSRTEKTFLQQRRKMIKTQTQTEKIASMVSKNTVHDKAGRTQKVDDMPSPEYLHFGLLSDILDIEQNGQAYCAGFDQGDATACNSAQIPADVLGNDSDHAVDEGRANCRWDLLQDADHDQVPTCNFDYTAPAFLINSLNDLAAQIRAQHSLPVSDSTPVQALYIQQIYEKGQTYCADASRVSDQASCESAVIPRGDLDPDTEAAAEGRAKCIWNAVLFAGGMPPCNFQYAPSQTILDVMDAVSEVVLATTPSPGGGEDEDVVDPQEICDMGRANPSSCKDAIQPSFGEVLGGACVFHTTPFGSSSGGFQEHCTFVKQGGASRSDQLCNVIEEEENCHNTTVVMSPMRQQEFKCFWYKYNEVCYHDGVVTISPQPGAPSTTSAPPTTEDPQKRCDMGSADSVSCTNAIPIAEQFQFGGKCVFHTTPFGLSGGLKEHCTFVQDESPGTSSPPDQLCNVIEEKENCRETTVEGIGSAPSHTIMCIWYNDNEVCRYPDGVVTTISPKPEVPIITRAPPTQEKPEKDEAPLHPSVGDDDKVKIEVHRNVHSGDLDTLGNDVLDQGHKNDHVPLPDKNNVDQKSGIIARTPVEYCQQWKTRETCVDESNEVGELQQS
ncbi:unnamed protein product [Amoebophrya sp. A120]|nr:unnamed protein product [Amoebophrya sp. A120]|eukprot:GSA120T00011974001.1